MVPKLPVLNDSVTRSLKGRSASKMLQVEQASSWSTW